MTFHTIILVVCSSQEVPVVNLQSPIFIYPITCPQKEIIYKPDPAKLIAFFEVHEPQPHPQSRTNIKTSANFLFQNEPRKKVMHACLQSGGCIKAVVTVFPFEPNLAKILATLQTDQIARVGLVRSLDETGTG